MPYCSEMALMLTGSPRFARAAGSTMATQAYSAFAESFMDRPVEIIAVPAQPYRSRDMNVNQSSKVFGVAVGLFAGFQQVDPINLM